jgi:hypothetical protein
VAHTKIASQTSFKGLFLQKVGTKLHVLRFCMSKPNFLQKKHILIDFLFSPICLCCKICPVALKNYIYVSNFNTVMHIASKQGCSKGSFIYHVLGIGS